jgi:5-methylcytosine-specific restriction endonuclease McrA
MGKRQRDWARRAYDRLILQLGGKCEKCGSLSALTIDHIEGCDFEHKAVEWSYRVSIYRREAKEGKLQVLCGKCNRKKGDPRAQAQVDEEAADERYEDGQYDLFTYVPPEDVDNEPF